MTSGQTNGAARREGGGIFLALLIWVLVVVALAVIRVMGLAGGTGGGDAIGLVAFGLGLALLVALVIGFVRRAPIGTLYTCMFITALALVGAGVAADDGVVGAAGAIGLIVTGAATALSWQMRRPAGPAAAPPTGGGLSEVRSLLEHIHDHVMLSDNAKRVLFRERELNLLRDAIEHDIGQGEYNVALTLCDEMADVFGYREEAEAFRGRILQSRQAQFENQVNEAMDQLDDLLQRRDWGAAHRAAARIRRLFGDSHLVREIEPRFHAARDDHKRELEARFLEAANRDDVERAMSILRELDRYLEPIEAERLTEVAQGVVSRHRENLGVQFKLAVNDHRWAEAAKIGDVIVSEFPNTKMAGEVRTVIDQIRTRATQAALTTD